jgi:hypothetical protein
MAPLPATVIVVPFGEIEELAFQKHLQKSKFNKENALRAAIDNALAGYTRNPDQLLQQIRRTLAHL